MNIAEELEQMISEMSARTNGAPSQIVCSQETLDQLWEQTRMIYVSEADLEEGRGYVGRYMGTPIIVSPTAEPGKLYLIPSQDSEPIRIDGMNDAQQFTYGVDFSGDVDMDNGWWLRSPFTHPYVGFQMDAPASGNGSESKRCAAKTSEKESEDIDESSFLNILKGGGGDVSV